MTGRLPTESFQDIIASNQYITASVVKRLLLISCSIMLALCSSKGCRQDINFVYTTV